MALVYLSSTFADLESARDLVYRALRRLGHDVIAMEDYVSTDTRPSDKCLEDVRSCDIYLGIFAWRYGYVPQEGGRRSITEMEFREAIKNKKSCLLFLLHEDAAWPKKFIDRNTESIDALRAEISRDFTVSFFRTEDELAMLASTAVTNLLHRAESKARVPRAQYLRSPWLGIEFWQNGKRCPLAKANGDVIQVVLKSEPFEVCFPTAGPDSPVMICASNNNDIFSQIALDINRENFRFFERGTGMADTRFGNGELRVRDDAHTHLNWERLMPRTEGGGIYMFNAVYNHPQEEPSFPNGEYIYIIVYIPNVGEEEILRNNCECFILLFEKV